MQYRLGFPLPGLPKPLPTLFMTDCFNLLPYKPDFSRPWVKSPLKTLWGKGENAGNQNFLVFPYKVFNPIKDKNHHFKYMYFNFVACKFFQFGPV